MNARRPGGAGGLGRAAPSRGRRLALVALALAGLGLGGCAALGLPSPCNPCGPPNPVRRLGQRVFNRNNGCGDCEPGMIGVGAAPVEVLEAPGVVAAPATVVPGAGPARVTPAPAEEAPPLELEPLDRNGSGNDSSSRRPGGTTSSNYEALRPRGGLQTARHEGGRPAGGPDPLANFVPRLEAPTELSGVPPPADAIPPREPAGAKASAEEAAPASSPPSPTTIPELIPTPDADAAAAPTDPVEAAASLAPGFRSFLSVEPKLAGGCRPEAAGWSWLADQGFRTVLDLRPADQVRHEDLARINASGLRYVSLPIGDEAVGDPATLGRFAAELALESARPLYFFDSDGSRAAVMWYLHRVVDRRAAPQDAAREADEIGPRDPTLWARAMAYVDRVSPPAVTPAAPTPPDSPVPDREEADPPANAPAPRSAAAGPIVTAVAEAASALVPPAGVAPPATPLPAPKPSDPHAWRSYVALAAAGLTVPLAFLGRTALSGVSRGRSRASLPPPAPRSRALPDASGA